MGKISTAQLIASSLGREVHLEGLELIITLVMLEDL